MLPSSLFLSAPHDVCNLSIKVNTGSVKLVSDLGIPINVEDSKVVRLEEKYCIFSNSVKCIKCCDHSLAEPVRCGGQQ